MIIKFQSRPSHSTAPALNPRAILPPGTLFRVQVDWTFKFKSRIWRRKLSMPSSRHLVPSTYLFPIKLAFCQLLLFSPKSGLTLCNPMDRSLPGLPVPHHLPEFAQVHVHWLSDAIQPSLPLLPSSHFGFNLSQYQGLFQCVCVWFVKMNQLDF